MDKEKALRLYGELKAMCPGLILAGSVLREKEYGIKDLDLIWVGKIFPMHLLPVGEMESIPKVSGSEILRFDYKGEQVDIYRTDKDKLGAMMLHLTGPKEFGIYLRSKAKKLGFKLSQYGLFKGDECVASKTEQEILDKLGEEFLKPKDRNSFRFINISM